MESVRFSKVLRSSYRNLREMLFDMDFGLRQVTQLDGRRLLLGTPPGDVLRPGSWRVVEGEGMPMRGGGTGSFGALLVHFEVEFPRPGELDSGALHRLQQAFAPASHGDEVQLAGGEDEDEEDEVKGGGEGQGGAAAGWMPPVRAAAGDEAVGDASLLAVDATEVALERPDGGRFNIDPDGTPAV